MPDRLCPVCRLIVSQYEPARVLVDGHWYHVECRRTADRIEAIAEGIKVLRTRDGVPVTDEQAEERARNIVQALSFEGGL